MRFKYAKLRDWGPFVGTHTISFDGTLIGIVGHNGSGKSTVVEALYSALTGRFRKYASLIDFVRDLPGGGKAKSGSIEVGFEHGDEEIVIRRTISATRTKSGLEGRQSAKLKMRHIGADEWDEYSGSKVVAAKVEELFGDNVTVMGQYAFVAQSEIAAIADSDDSTRTKALHKLFGLDRFEKLWTMLGQELASIPEIHVADDIQELKRERDKGLARCRELQTAIDGISRELAGMNADAAQSDIDVWSRTQELQTKITEATTTVSHAKADLDSAKQREATALEKVNRVAADRDAVADRAYQAREFLAAASAAAVALADQQRLNKEAAGLVSRLRECVAAKPQAPITSWNDDDRRLSALRAKLLSSQEFLDEHQAILQSGDGVAAVCPTCKQPIPDLASAIDSHQKTIAELGPAVSDLAAKQLAKDRAAQEYATAVARHSSELEALRARSDEVRKEYEALNSRLPSDPSRYSETELAKRRSVIAEHDSLSGIVSSESSHLQECKQRTASAESSLADADKLLEGLRQQVSSLGVDPSKFTPAYVEACRETLRVSSAKREERIRVTEQLNAAKRDVENVEGRLARASQLAEQAERANFVRDTMRDARGLFHRDHIPMVMARRYLSAVGAALAKFLELMGSDFTAGLEQKDGNYDFRCVFDDSSERTASNVSGGQKVRFAISFLLAVNEVLASKLGVLALDEPTNQLDDDNIQHLSEVLAHVRQFAHSAGIQIFVVTHDKQLSGSFDQTVRLVRGKQAA